MTTIEQKARMSYFDKAQSSLRADIYTSGYKNGFLQALSEVLECMTSTPNNKDRLIKIAKMIDDYDKDWGREKATLVQR